MKIRIEIRNKNINKYRNKNNNKDANKNNNIK